MARAVQPPPAPPRPSAPPATASKKPPDPRSRQPSSGGSWTPPRRNPDSFDAHHQLASFYLQQGKLDGGPSSPRTRLRHRSRPTTTNGYDLALALLETGNLDEARAQIERMMAAKETGELHNLLGDVEERAGNLAGAAEEYQRAAHMAPTEEHLFDWGNNLLQLRAFEEATQVFTAAIAPPSAVGEALRRPGHRAVRPRAVRGCRQSVLSGRRSRTVGSAPLPVSRRDVRRRPRRWAARSPSVWRGSPRRSRETRWRTSTTR